MKLLFGLCVLLVLALTASADCQLPPTCQDWCNFNGVYANATGVCRCNKGYATHNPQDNHSQCNYQQTPQLTAFLTQFFVGWIGVADFIVGRTAIGVGKVIYYNVSPCVIAALGVAVPHVAVALGAAWGMGAFGWWLADTILYGLNRIPDSNGVALMPMS